MPQASAARVKFGTSGWRAVLAEEFTFATARRAVEAIARHLRPRKNSGPVLIGYDTRFLAGEFASEAARIFLAHGFEARMSNRSVPTPVLSFETIREKAIGALNFTASHNPPRYLGLKFSTADGAPALPAVTAAIEKRIESVGSIAEPKARAVPLFDPAPAYLSALSKRVPPSAPAKQPLALDFRFGTSAGYLDRFFESARTPLYKIHSHPDPLFGGQSPQCSERELSSLARIVREKKCRLGLATDGDADRFGVLDEKGDYVSPNAILALLAWDLLGKTRSKKGIARSVATTHALDAIARFFGVPLYETPVGFKYIGELLLAGKILIGGEESAGLTIDGHVPEKDGILAGILVARAVAASGRTLSQLLASLEKEIGPFRSNRSDLPLSDAARARLRKLRKAPPEKFANESVARVNEIDGLKLILKNDSWILFRESGTEPVARVYAEARTREDVDRLLAAGEKLLEGR